MTVHCPAITHSPLDIGPCGGEISGRAPGACRKQNQIEWGLVVIACAMHTHRCTLHWVGVWEGRKQMSQSKSNPEIWRRLGLWRPEANCLRSATPWAALISGRGEWDVEIDRRVLTELTVGD